MTTTANTTMFSAALCRGLIEASALRGESVGVSWFSAALCRGLIEAGNPRFGLFLDRNKFSAALCRGLIEARDRKAGNGYADAVFRGFMPRPH